MLNLSLIVEILSYINSDASSVPPTLMNISMCSNSEFRDQGGGGALKVAHKTLASKTLVTTSGHWEWVEYPIMFYIPLLSNRFNFLVPGNQTGGFFRSVKYRRVWFLKALT